MKRCVLICLIMGVALLSLLMFVSCDTVLPDGLRAKKHLKSGNDYYRKEQFKKAIHEYETALEYDPDLEIVYPFLGTACSALYKPSIAPPDQNPDYSRLKAEKESLEMQIAANQDFINAFIETHPEFADKLQANEDLRLQIQDVEDEIKMIEGYESYRGTKGETEDSRRRLEANTEYIRRLKENMEASEAGEESADSDDEEEGRAAPADYASQMEELTRLQEENDELREVIEKNRSEITAFESKEQFQQLQAQIQEYENQISRNREFFKTLEDYELYRSKVDEAEKFRRTMNANQAYIRRVEENEIYREKALRYLQKAKDVQPDNDQVILALSEIYDKIGNFEDAETYYLMMLDKAENKAQAFYTLAEFYTKHGQYDKAEEMYRNRIALDPTDIEGLLFYINFLQNLRKFDKAIDVHKNRIAIIIDPSSVEIQSEIDQIKENLARIKNINQYIENVQKNRSIPQDQKEKLLEEKRQQMAEIGDEEALKNELEAKQAELQAKIELSDEEMAALPDDKKQLLADAYYRLGVVLWNKSYQTPPDFMAAQERLQVVDEGFEALETATELSPDFPDPWAYMKLLYLQKIIAEPLKADEYRQKGDEMGAKFTELRKKQLAREAYMRQLEDTEIE